MTLIYLFSRGNRTEQLVHTLYQFLYFFFFLSCPSPQTLPLCASSVGRLELVGGGSLQISNLTEEDGGVYTCTASNANATIEAQTQLTVQGTFSKPHPFFFSFPTPGKKKKERLTLHQVRWHQECWRQASHQMECDLTPSGAEPTESTWSVDCNICALHERGAARPVTASLARAHLLVRARTLAL